MDKNRALVSLVAGWLLAGLAGPAFAQWITFPASPDEYRNERKEHGADYGSTPVRGFLSIPVEAGRHPAVVMLPSCAGRRPFHQSWAEALSERGYVALVVDDYFMHDRDRTCGLREPAERAEVLRMRLMHARGATRYLATRPEVDRWRMAVMGWGDAPVGILLEDGNSAGAEEQVFGAAVLVSPADCDPRFLSPSRPLLMLQSEAGAAQSGDGCSAEGEQAALETRVYEGTLPGFDDPQAGLNRAANSAGSEASDRRYDRLAHVRAIDDVTAFLNRRLQPAPGAGGQAYAAAAVPEVAEVGTWAVDPNEPGPDLPPQGGSAFDAVFSRADSSGAVYDVPFPYQRLLQKLENAAGGATMSRSPVDSTLIPLGRSLQREAAAPDYFRSPRIVTAVTSEPDSGVGPLGVRLKDRLFLGYQPRVNVLEVISYNASANRFEFQVVRNYGPGQKPRVGYAPRALCMSCHHNAAPIFADASWDETTANAQVASRLNGLGSGFHGVPVEEGDRAVTAIDASSDAANLLPVYQQLWSQGCASEQLSEVARCRGGALKAMVQYRLSNSAGFNRSDPLFAGGYLALQRRNWTQRWPDGLLIPNANLPNRSPLMSPSPSLVSVALDPLRQRPPFARWQASSNRDLERLVRALSHDLPDQHMKLLEQHLRGDNGRRPSRAMTANCKVSRRGSAGRSRLFQIECGTRPAIGTDFYLQAQFQVTPAGEAEGEANWLEINGGGYARRAVIGRVENTQSKNRIELRFVGRDGAGVIRAPDGNALLDFALFWDKGVSDSETKFEAVATLDIANDFHPIGSAFERVTANPSASSPLLADRFEGARLAKWLLAELGVQTAPPCCESRTLPEPRLDTEGASTDEALSVALEHRGPLLTFRRYCGTCHGSDSDFPPGFLHGSGEAILDSIAQCAERIYYRLSMWHRRSEDQVVPPMPPIQGLSLARTTANDWRKSEPLERLTRYAQELLIKQGRDPKALLDESYHATRACLPKRNLMSFKGQTP